MKLLDCLLLQILLGSLRVNVGFVVCYLKYQHILVDFGFLFKGTSTLVGHFVSAPGECRKGTKKS